MMKGGLGNIMKQAQKMQEEMKAAQEKLEREEVTGEAGGGMVKVVMTGRHDVKRVSIDDALLQDDKEMLEDIVTAAVNDAVNRIASSTQDRMSDMTAGIPMPPGMKLPF